ncbi:hypothetical protein ACTXT7_017298, partial [Hymenolepis weldensis]
MFRINAEKFCSLFHKLYLVDVIIEADESIVAGRSKVTIYVMVNPCYVKISPYLMEIREIGVKIVKKSECIEECSRKC